MWVYSSAREAEIYDELRLLCLDAKLRVRNDVFNIRRSPEGGQRGSFKSSGKGVEMGRIEVVVDVRLGVRLGMSLEPCEVLGFVGILL